MRTTAAVLGFATLALVMMGCPKAPVVEPIGEKDYARPLADDGYALRKLSDDAIPDFTMALTDRKSLREAAVRSLNYLSKPSSQNYFPYPLGPRDSITHSMMVATLTEFLALLDSHEPARSLNETLRRKFDVYMSVGCDDRGTVLFTGYYTPIFDASPVRTERFAYPIYRQPDDLVKAPDGEVIGRRGSDGAIRRYPEREYIERSNMLKGLELYWLGDPFEVYIAHVQGSAILRMPDGSYRTAGYAANNGHEYRSVAMALIEDGKMERDQLSLQVMIDYFKANPAELQTYTCKNPRFVFFTSQPGNESPRGSLNEPVTPMRTIATDKTIFPRGGLTFIETRLPRIRDDEIEVSTYANFAFDQDTGGAIRAPGRCDVYMGVGDEAAKLAGRTYEEGQLYYLFLKPNVRVEGTVTQTR